MTWSPKTSNGFESSKVASVAVPYVRGRCLDLGCGQQKMWPQMTGVDNAGTFGPHTAADILSDIADLGLFADNSWDGVFSSHALEDFDREKVPAVLKEWSRVIKVGGYLSLYVPSANLYPLCGEPGANPHHKWNIYPGDVEAILKDCTDCGWTQVEREERGGTNEYSLFLVFQKRDDGIWEEDIWARNPDGKKRCLVVRYGAIGDQIMAASVLPGLQAQGFFITYNTTPDAQKILARDPHIDEFLIQDKDQVPNAQLGPYWISLQERYDQIVNLCESVEGQLLTLPGRLQHTYPEHVRRKLLGKNYLEQTHDIAGVPYDFAARFYPSVDEIAWARKMVQSFGGPVIAWAINGSAIHKVYPWIQIVCSWLLERSPCHIVLMADGVTGKQLQEGILGAVQEAGGDMARIHGRAGAWGIRESLTFARAAHCVVGPETGILNAVGMEAVPKVIYLSHSTQENLTKHWANTIALEADVEKVPCARACHRLHYSWDFCNQDPVSGAAACAAAIGPDEVFKAIALQMGAARKVAA